MARLKECVDVIRALLAGEEVSHDGLVTVDRARLWTRPEIPPLLIGTAVSVETAGWVGTWADGLATIKTSRRSTCSGWSTSTARRAGAGRWSARCTSRTRTR